MGDGGARIAVVTGGGRGIGRAVVDRLHADGSKVVTCGRSARPGDLDAGVFWVQADVARTADAARVVAAAAEFGHVSVLVNNAGIQLEKTVRDTTDDDWSLVMDVNCKGVFNMCREVLPDMIERGGSIVNLGSISGLVSDPSMAIYNASKGFVHALTRSIAVDHGPMVRCNAVCPGWIMTNMAESGFVLSKEPSRAKADAIARHPARRFGTPDDVANAIAWLVSEQAGFVTGQCFTIDGGLTAASPLQPGLF
ncbi:SDR family NAD(P)-dependent oxidoreductase (plasmid) [Rhizobium sp. CB3171]|uniref:SDR family NAD(P)-dependent oxidoreductase n=1 Tax=Rhizobium sp. CB3171 TaxID=3039157 RepID=UPI0024B1253F|nr:SDR family oxidoreductase [Rhizobium sp. CB3171]WFU05762.1 SDR family NAD(P)-dependent oxidoreductase [Rhizobium sp. CB3171]